MGLLGWLTNRKSLLDSAAETYLESIVAIFSATIVVSAFAPANSPSSLLQLMLFIAFHDQNSPEDFKNMLNGLHKVVNTDQEIGLAHVCQVLLVRRSLLTNQDSDTFNAIGKYLEKAGGTTEQVWGVKFSEGDFQNAVNALRNIAKSWPLLMNTPVQAWLEESR